MEIGSPSLETDSKHVGVDVVLTRESFEGKGLTALLESIGCVIW